VRTARDLETEKYTRPVHVPALEGSFGDAIGREGSGNRRPGDHRARALALRDVVRRDAAAYELVVFGPAASEGARRELPPVARRIAELRRSLVPPLARWSVRLAWGSTRRYLDRVEGELDGPPRNRPDPGSWADRAHRELSILLPFAPWDPGEMDLLDRASTARLEALQRAIEEHAPERDAGKQQRNDSIRDRAPLSESLRLGDAAAEREQADRDAHRDPEAERDAEPERRRGRASAGRPGGSRNQAPRFPHVSRSGTMRLKTGAPGFESLESAQ
jgi:hypothetical protein